MLHRNLKQEEWWLAGRRLAQKRQRDDEQVCGGTLISRQQYLTHTEEWGYEDGRIAKGYMMLDQVRDWTGAIDTAP